MTASQTGHQSTASTATSTALPLSTATRELFAIGGRKQPPPSVQLLYTELCQGDRNIASDGSSLYCWKGDHWSTQSEQENIRHALDYLRSNAPHKMSSDNAAKCFKTALNYVAPLPAKPDAEAVIVPVTGARLTLRDGQWTASEPRREIGITHRIAVRFPVPWGPYQPKPISPSSLFGQFLNRSLPDAEVQATVQEFIGSTLSARPTQLAVIFLGNGNNGKSVLLNIVRALHEKTAALQLDKLEGFNLVPIVGASLAISDEIPDRAIQQQQFKSLVSGGTVQIRPLYTPAFAYNPTAKFIINANFLPPTRDNTDGWWRRLLIVEWPVQIAYEDLIPDLDNKIIRDELHIVLDWALEGLRRVAARNFKPAKVLPKAISQAHRSAVLQANRARRGLMIAGWRSSVGCLRTRRRCTNIT
jgi:putative DNA primase/helicase